MKDRDKSELAWQGEQVKRTPVRSDDTIIYETHVRGFTKLHPAVPEELRGTYAERHHKSRRSFYKQSLAGCFRTTSSPNVSTENRKRRRDRGQFLWQA